MLHGVQGVSFVVLSRPLNVSVLAVSGDLLVSLSYLAALGVAVFYCPPTLGVFVPTERLQPQKRDYYYMGYVLCSFIELLRKNFVCFAPV